MNPQMLVTKQDRASESPLFICPIFSSITHQSLRCIVRLIPISSTHHLAEASCFLLRNCHVLLLASASTNTDTDTRGGWAILEICKKSVRCSQSHSEFFQKIILFEDKRSTSKPRVQNVPFSSWVLAYQNQRHTSAAYTHII